MTLISVGGMPASGCWNLGVGGSWSSAWIFWRSWVGGQHPHLRYDHNRIDYDDHWVSGMLRSDQRKSVSS